MSSRRVAFGLSLFLDEHSNERRVLGTVNAHPAPSWLQNAEDSHAGQNSNLAIMNRRTPAVP